MNDPAAQERKAQLYLQHPEGSPEKIIGPLDYLMHPPSKLSSTASWEEYRDKTLLPMIQHRPDDPNLPNYLKQVEEVLAWRATISPADRFWRANPEPNDAAARDPEFENDMEIARAIIEKRRDMLRELAKK